MRLGTARWGGSASSTPTPGQTAHGRLARRRRNSPRLTTRSPSAWGRSRRLAGRHAEARPRRRRHRRRDRPPTRADLAAVEAGLPVFCEKTRPGPSPRATRWWPGCRPRASRTDRLPATLRRRLPGRADAVAAGELVDGAPPSAPHPRPGASRRRVRRRVRPASSGMRLSTNFDTHPLGDRPRGGRGLRNRQQQGRLIRRRRRATPRRPCHLDTALLCLVPTPRYNPRGYDVRLVGARLQGQHRRRPGEEVAPWLGQRSWPRPPACPTRMFMDRLLAAYQAGAGGVAELVEGAARSPGCTWRTGSRPTWSRGLRMSLREHRPVRIEEVRP